jgi:CRP-like cAMP-binding protein
VRQGEPGDRFYAVVHGSLDVVMSGEHIRTAARGSFFGEVALLADVPRTATVTAATDGDLLALDRVPFLVAVTGSDTSRAAAWGVVRSLRLDTDLPADAGAVAAGLDAAPADRGSPRPIDPAADPSG